MSADLNDTAGIAMEIIAKLDVTIGRTPVPREDVWKIALAANAQDEADVVAAAWASFERASRRLSWHWWWARLFGILICFGCTAAYIFNIYTLGPIAAMDIIFPIGGYYSAAFAVVGRRKALRLIRLSEAEMVKRVGGPPLAPLPG